MSLTATVTHIARGSLHDGPGVRTVIYFKGCSLRCLWCHNPETISPSPMIARTEVSCIGCGACHRLCPDVHHLTSEGLGLSRENCRLCGRCAEACPTGALSVVGERYSAQRLLEVIERDAHFYRASGGGVTFSGGECLLSAEFVGALARMCRKKAIHTAVETALHLPWERVAHVLPDIDLFFADLKMSESARHRIYTGSDNRLILENLSRLSHEASSLIVRIPVIPGVNDTDEEITGMGDILRNLGDKLLRVELLKYNHLAKGKYSLVGLPYTSFAEEVQTDSQIQALCDRLSQLSGRACTY